MQKPTTISLVLGSGGARGLAHIGVIRYLEEHNYKIEAISGCSIGSLIGGIYAIGKLDVFERWVTELNKIDILTLLDISWSSAGLVKGDKIIATLIDLIGDANIEDLDIRFTAVAADVQNEKEVWINSGELFSAIRASISLPLFFTPYTINGIQLIDGGTLNPVPIAPVFHDNSDYTIAVNLGAKVKTQSSSVELTNIKKQKVGKTISKFINYIQERSPNPSSSNFGAYEIANQAFDAMQNTIAQQKLASYPPDITVDIARNACGTLEFDKASQMIQLGYEQAKKALSAIESEDAK